MLVFEIPWPQRFAANSKEGLKASTLLAGGWKAVLWALTGDLDYFCSMLGTPNYSLASGPCMHCRCKMTGPETWSDFRSEAAWRTTRWDPEEWRTWEQRTKCVLLTLPGASCWTIAYDWVHVKYLGVDQYIFGSVLFVLVCMVMEGEQEANLAACWVFLNFFPKQQDTNTISLFDKAFDVHQKWRQIPQTTWQSFRNSPLRKGFAGLVEPVFQSGTLTA